MKRILQTAVVLALGLTLAVGVGAQDKSKKKILFFTKSSGFEHTAIKKKGDDPSPAEKVLLELAAKNNWEVTHTKDGSVFTKENIAKYDAFVFYTTGDLTKEGTDKNPPMSVEGKAAFLEAIKNGKGFVGSHSAADTFHSAGSRFQDAGEKADPYIQMIGGEFIRHGAQQKSKMICHDPKFPGADAFKDSPEINEEWYSFKDYAKDLHVILAQETEGMKKVGGDSVYNRPPYPATWARMHGKGRVFYTSMGHREQDVWPSPMFQSLLAGGINWAVGNVEADVTPNVEKATPGFRTIPPEK
jgi:type 1 glutamine amidotransferase